MRVVYIWLDGCTEHWFASQDPAAAPPAYRARLAAMKSTAARARTTAGLWLLSQAMGDDGDRLAAIGFSASGRPMLEGGPAFSISHSRRLVACAWSDEQAVGLDVEASDSRPPARLAARLGLDTDTLARDPQRFFSDWCAREATVKASGRVGLARIHRIALNGERATLDDNCWWLRPLAIVPGYAGCLASNRSIEALTCEPLSLAR